jgi:DNA-directed RNA polymerase specialized sigma24 family protein
MLVLAADGFTQAEIAQAFAVSRAAVAKHISQARLACAAAPQIIDHIAEIGWQHDSGCAGGRPVSLYG